MRLFRLVGRLEHEGVPQRGLGRIGPLPVESVGSPPGPPPRSLTPILSAAQEPVGAASVISETRAGLPGRISRFTHPLPVTMYGQQCDGRRVGTDPRRNREADTQGRLDRFL